MSKHVARFYYDAVSDDHQKKWIVHDRMLGTGGIVAIAYTEEAADMLVKCLKDKYDSEYVSISSWGMIG